MKITLGILGDRDFRDYQKLKEVFEAFIEKYNLKPKIATNGLPNLSAIGSQFSKEKNLTFINFFRKREKDSVIQLINNCNFLFVFWDGSSKLLASAIQEAKNRNVQVFKYNTIKKEFSKEEM